MESICAGRCRRRRVRRGDQCRRNGPSTKQSAATCRYESSTLPISKESRPHRRTTFRLEVQYAESSLRAATAAVEATGKPVKIETEILWGSPDTALINESRNASMVCVGSVGIGAMASKMWGSTAATLAEKAYCPVAIIRSPHNVAGLGARLDRRRRGGSRRQRVGHRTRNERGATA